MELIATDSLALSDLSMQQESTQNFNVWLLNENELGVPVLGICYGQQELAFRLHKDNVVAGVHREYGSAELTASKSINAHVDRLFRGIEGAN